MLINFSVANFRSIAERQSLVMEATNDRHLSHSHLIEAPASHSLLKSVVVYGANASGKSNLLAAMLWMRKFVVESLGEKVEKAKIPVDTNLLRKDLRQGSSVFEVEILIGEDRYRFGFAVNEDGIEEEWLYRKRPKGKEANIFIREGQEIVPNQRQEEGLKPFIPRTRPNTLFLRVCAEFNFEFAENVMAWFRNWLFASSLNEAGFYRFTAKSMEQESIKADILQFSKKADFQIIDIKGNIQSVHENDLTDDLPVKYKKQLLSEGIPEIKTYHQSYDENGKQEVIVEFDLEFHESEGTKKFIALAGPVLYTIEKGAILVIDEFEARLHPILTKAIIDWFHSPQNSKGAQIIVATHDTGLMTPESVRRDQIWFCEKDDKGATELYSLDEFNKQEVRNNTKFNRQYMQGIFGAVPKVALEEFYPG